MIKKLGKAFADDLEFHGYRPRKLDLSNDESKDSEKIANPGKKRFFLLVICIFIFLLLIVRLVFLTVINGQKNREISDNNRIRLNVIKAPRGIIYDRNNVPLVQNSPLYLTIKKDGSLEVVGRDEALKLQASGLENIYSEPAREYIYASESAHLLGYLSEIRPDELKRLKSNGNADYKQGDFIGRLGFEQTAENILRGIDGREVIETDATGRITKHLGTQKSIPGHDVKISIDVRLQKLLAKHFPSNKKGAVVALNPENGEVLGMFSSPTFDANLFGQLFSTKSDFKIKKSELQKILVNKDSPLFNRAIGGIYPAGSTFKIAVSTAALESGAVTKDTEFEDTGEIVIGPYKFPNWYFLEYGKKDGMVNVVKALKRSNDIYFYKVSEKLGVDGIGEMAKKFGFGEKTGIDLPQESAGLIPDETWKKKNIGDSWYLGDTYHLSIGQGFLLATPLQVAQMTTVIANDGLLCQPHLLMSSDTKESYCKSLNLKKETIKIVKEGMKEACTTGGTGWPFFDFKVKYVQTGEEKNVEVGCKTGTAEFGDVTDRTHAWFTIFAPFENPKIVLTVLVEGAGQGSDIGGPVAKSVLQEWLGEE